MNHNGRLYVVTVRKQVEEPVRIAIAEKISNLLDERTPLGKKVLTQGELGTLIGVSQEAVRRAREPDGVTPAIVNGMAKRFGPLEKQTDLGPWRREHNHMLHQVRERGGLEPEGDDNEDAATAALIRKGVGTRDAQRAIRAVREYTFDRALDPAIWAEIGLALVTAVAKQDQSSRKPNGGLNLAQETSEFHKGSSSRRNKGASK